MMKAQKAQKAEQKAMMLGNTAAQLAKDEKYREAADMYKSMYLKCGKDSQYKWFALLAVFSLLGHKDLEANDEDVAFMETIAGDKKEPTVFRAQARCSLGFLGKDEDKATALMKEVVSLYDGMSRLELKTKLMNGGDARGPTFTTVGAYRDDKDGVYNTALKFLAQADSEWASPKQKKKAARAAAAEDASDSESDAGSSKITSSVLMYSALAVTLSMAIYYFWPKSNEEL
ncbi:hypothetical protein HDU98_008787 [Podochytrium sp. JEL0797]|nr:hypothetical protein HDU98_008787 [Podochytrium sp. JEL0797]